MPLPPTKKEKDPKSNTYYLLRYGSIAFQLAVALMVVIFLGVQLDRLVNWGFSLFAWLFPIILIIAMIFKVIKDTSRNNEK